MNPMFNSPGFVLSVGQLINLRQVWQSCADILIVMPGRKEKSAPINGMKNGPVQGL